MGSGQRELSAGPGNPSFAVSPGGTAIASVGARLRNTASVRVLNGSHCCLRLQEAWESDYIDRAGLVGTQKKGCHQRGEWASDGCCWDSGALSNYPNNNPPEIALASIAGEDSRVGKR